MQTGDFSRILKRAEEPEVGQLRDLNRGVEERRRRKTTRGEIITSCVGDAARELELEASASRNY